MYLASPRSAPAPEPTARVEVRVEVRPRWPWRMRPASPDGLFRRRGDSLHRLVHVGEDPVFCGALQAAPERVLLAGRAATRDAAEEGIGRMRFALGLDDDLRAFHRRFARDPWIGRSVRTYPELRAFRRPDPWEALAWAVTEQLIEYERAAAIQRRMTAAIGRRCDATGLRDSPSPQRIADEAPARLQSFDLSAGRAAALKRIAKLVASRRLDLGARDPEPGWARLLAEPGIGPWTVEMLALYGQGRYDQVPAADVGYLKLVGRLLTGNPKARAEIPEVRAFFERYGEWKGLAAEHLRCAAGHGWLTDAPRA